MKAFRNKTTLKTPYNIKDTQPSVDFWGTKTYNKLG